VAALAALVVLTTLADARAQLEELEEGIAVGAFTFYPSLELRLRGEYRRHPLDVGGDVYERHAVHLDEAASAVPPIVRRDPPVDDQWLVAERARLGLVVTWEMLQAGLVLEDARVLGIVPGASDGVAQGGFGSFAPYQAYLDVRDDVDDPLIAVRLGRQAFEWGDGRLIGDSDFGPRGSSFDALRATLRIEAVEIQLLAALLAPPGSLPADARSEPSADSSALGTGAQLYGLDAAWPIHPLFGVEVTGLARVVREPVPFELTRGDTFVVDGRLFGDHRGVSYAAEGAYQGGRTAGFGVLRDVSAYAFAARVAWQTALTWDLSFGARGAYASGEADGAESLSRFDPIVPEVRDNHGLMGLYAWSNLIEAGAEIGARPIDELRAVVAYAFVGLAEPADRWTTASLVPVGAAPTNSSHALGHEVDVTLEVSPWEPLRFGAGYGLMVLEGGGRAVLEAAGRGSPDLLHYALVEAELKAP
jgi:hypothetical protein